ncbi:MAG: hypothetical protein HONBIEJF_01238 [Fimbriimonadaceae bacterium]|nr:hypothetical protein [Fimbriimonadaceae bacterium]
METPTLNEAVGLEKPRDKRKLLVIACLTIAVFGIGAFQFVGMSGNAPKSRAKKTKESTTKHEQTSDSKLSADDEIKKQLVSQLVSGVLPRRDPFQPNHAPAPTDTPAVEKEHVPDRPKPPSVPRGGGNQGYREVPPFDPKIEGELPPARGGEKPVNVEKSAPLRQPNEFAYTLTGVIVGEKSMCVFQNDAGNQFLVPVGGTLDGDSRITKITRGEVTVRHRGKDVTFKIGGH